MPRYDFTILKRRYRKTGWTLAEYGRKTGLNYTTISKALTRGTASQKTAKKMGKVLDLEYEDLVPEDAA